VSIFEIYGDQMNGPNGEKTKKIGGVTLDYSKYPGEDYYCDGNAEDEILDIVRNNDREKFPEIISSRKDWATLYHLSPARGNIVRWIPMNGTEKVLEIGAGPGAITETLSSMAGEVECVDLSAKRSEINATRNKDRDNITIHVGNFVDVEPTLADDFDYIFLIGVFEYAGSYMDSAAPFHDELLRILPHLKKGGRIVIAIENRLGLKYFAGAREDHTGRYFDGIESYENSGMSVRTFSRAGLERIFVDCGITDYSFYYPYPDYKFTSEVYSDGRLPKASELTDNIRNFDRDRLLLFDEKAAYSGIVGDGLFPQFSNSYEVVIGPPLPVEYTKFSTERSPEYRIMTGVIKDSDGKRRVVKTPLTAQAEHHTARMEDSYRKLSDRYGSRTNALKICPCRIDSRKRAVFDYIEGRTLETMLDKCLAGNDMENFLKLTDKYLELVGTNSGSSASDGDMTFANIMINGLNWTAIDYEWEEDRSIPARDMLARALTVYVREDPKRSKQIIPAIKQHYGISDDDIAAAAEEEKALQIKVSGNSIPLSAQRNDYGTKVIVPGEIIAEDPALRETAAKEDEARRNEETKEVSLTSVQVYYDSGKGFSEEESFFLKERYADEGCISFEINVPENVKTLRIDPALCPCFAMVREAAFGRADTSAITKLMRFNGSMDRSGVVVFTTDDPCFTWDMKRMRRAAMVHGDAKIKMTLQMCGMPSTMARRAEKGECR